MNDEKEIWLQISMGESWSFIFAFSNLYLLISIIVASLLDMFARYLVVTPFLME